MSDAMIKRSIGTVLVCATTLALAVTARADSLSLQVNPVSGLVTVTNSTASALSLDGYEIDSSSGQLIPGAGHWTTLTSTTPPDWVVGSGTVNALSELDLKSSVTVPAGGSINLGSAFTTLGTQDVQFSYSSPDHTVTANAPVSYQFVSGMTVRIVNLLTNHSASVQQTVGVLVNQDPVSSHFDGYSIESASGSLHPSGFTGLTGLGTAGWQKPPTSPNGIAELNLTGSITLAAGHDIGLGTMFTTAAAQDLTFQYDLIGYGPLNANVQYSNELYGDVNHDGVVNGLDIASVASHWLSVGTPTGDANYDGVVNGLDISAVAAHWLNVVGSPGGGSGTAAASVPEPSTLGLLMLGLLSGSWHLGRRAKRQGSRD